MAKSTEKRHRPKGRGPSETYDGRGPYVCVCVCVCVCAGRRGQCSVLTICEAVSAEWLDLEWFWGYQTCGGGGMGERGGIVSNHVRVCVLGFGVHVRLRAPSRAERVMMPSQ